ncbi:MAG: 50S ribosomal protein L15 [Candidatus Omnitrophota bacterium]
MKISEIGMPKGANKRIKRRGRGAGSGHGKTSCKGHKGLLSRSGGHGGPRLGFEGGQMPLARRMPKRGFNSPFPQIFQVVNVGSLANFKAGSVVTVKELREQEIVKTAKADIKILGGGELGIALTVKAQAFSSSAIEKIKKAGGQAEIIK